MRWMLGYRRPTVTFLFLDLACLFFLDPFSVRLYFKSVGIPDLDPRGAYCSTLDDHLCILCSLIFQTSMSSSVLAVSGNLVLVQFFLFELEI